jgi:hypothetical protein
MTDPYSKKETIKYLISDLAHRLSRCELDSEEYNRIQNQLIECDYELKKYNKHIRENDVKAAINSLKLIESEIV